VTILLTLSLIEQTGASIAGASAAAANIVGNGLPLGNALLKGTELFGGVNPLCATSEVEGALGLLLLMFLLAVSVMIIYLLLRFHIHWFPESVGVILVGVVVGIIIRVIPSIDLPQLTQLDPTIFFEILLPAIIFEAGYTLEKEDFFYNIGSITLFAFIGTVISTIVVACGIYLLTFTGIFKLEINLIDCFLFGSLISAVDPVATLAIFNALKVNPTLHYLVFGESVVNDAVAITLFTTFKSFKNATPSDSTFKTVLTGAWIFTLNSLGSVIFALFCGFASALFFRFIDMRKYPTLEITLFLFFAYGPYLISLPYLSGIMVILILGIVMSYYTAPNMSKLAQDTISNASKSIAFISETFVFIYLGFACFSFKNQHWDILLIVFVLIFCLIGRFLNIVPLSAIVNFYRKERISFKNQFIMWFSGLRGAIAFALSIEFLSPSEGVEGQYLFTTTLAVVLFTIVIFGGGTYPFLKLLKVKSKEEEIAERGGALASPMIRDRALHEQLVLKINNRFFRNWFVRPSVMNQMHADLRAATEMERQQRENMNNNNNNKGNDFDGVKYAEHENFEMKEMNKGEAVVLTLSPPRSSEEATDSVALYREFINNPQKLSAVKEALALYEQAFTSTSE